MNDFIRYTVQQGIALIGLSRGPVNALGQSVRNELLCALEVANHDSTVGAIILHGYGELPFSAGADITEFGTPAAFASPSLPDVLSRIGELDKPVIAAIGKLALGGGLELALACGYRIAGPEVRLGLPEIRLGLLPGAGGTQRLPRIIGASAALDMIISGEPVNASKAFDISLLDRVAARADSLLEEARDFAAALINTNAPAHPGYAFDNPGDGLQLDYFDEYLNANRQAWKDRKAPVRVVHAIEAACHLPLEQGLEVELGLFREAEASRESAALRHVFFAEREVTRQPGIDKHTDRRPVHTVAVIGAGTMGAGIAMCFANAGIPVTLLEVRAEALQRGLEQIRTNYQTSFRRGKLTQQQVEQRIGLIRGTLEYADLAEMDLVIEAVFENLEIKQKVFRTLDEICRPGAILASNTSTLDVDAIAAVTRRPQDVVGLHFFSPANVMRLLEVVRGRATSPEVLASTLEIAKRIGKLPVVSGVCFGFIGNRMLEPYSREALRMLLEGASPAQIDKVITGLGFAMGILATHDLAGIDVTFLVREGIREAIAHDKSYCKIGDALYQFGRLGQKSGRGYYLYQGRDRKDDPEILTLATQLAEQLGIAQRHLTDEEIHDRCMLMLINEGIQLLDEGIAQRSGDIDLVWINGYGFPVWLGGPLHYAETLGLAHVLNRIQHYQESLGEYGQMWFQPAALLERLVKAGKNTIERT